jgi:DNA-binding beta-propeller fold protein YncE
VARSVGVDGGGGSVYFVIDTNNHYSAVHGPSVFPSSFPVSFAFNSGNGLLYVAPRYFEVVMGVSSYPVPGQNVSVINGTTLQQTTRLSSSNSSDLLSIVYDPQNNEIYVGNSTSSGNSVTSINAANNAVAGVANLPGPAGAMFVDPVNNYLYVVIAKQTYVYSST